MSKKTAFETEWFSIESEDFPDIHSLNGKPIYRINLPESSAIVAFTKKKEIILVKQFRPAIKKFTLELPAGVVDPGETPTDAMKRELLEETGFECQSLAYVHSGGLMMDRLNTSVHIFYGEEARRIDSAIPEAGLEVVLLPLKDLRRLCASGEFTNIAALGAILWVQWTLTPKTLIDF